MRQAREAAQARAGEAIEHMVNAMRAPSRGSGFVITAACKVLEVAGMTSAHEAVLERVLRVLKRELPPEQAARVVRALMSER